MRSIEQRWAALIPEPAERLAWQAAFGDSVTYAEIMRPHFEDPLAAANWSSIAMFTGPICAHLHQHGITPDANAIMRTIDEVGAPDLRGNRCVALSVALAITHPELPTEDRDLLIGSHLTIVEIDHLVHTGMPNRGTLATLAALH